MLRFLSQMFTLSQPMFVCSSVAEVLMQDHSIPKGHTHTLELKRADLELNMCVNCAKYVHELCQICAGSVPEGAGAPTRGC